MLLLFDKNIFPDLKTLFTKKRLVNFCRRASQIIYFYYLNSNYLNTYNTRDTDNLFWCTHFGEPQNSVGIIWENVIIVCPSILLYLNWILRCYWDIYQIKSVFIFKWDLDVILVIILHGVCHAFCKFMQAVFAVRQKKNDSRSAQIYRSC